MQLPSTLVSTVQHLTKLTISVVSPETKEKAQLYLIEVRKSFKDVKNAVTALKKPHKDAMAEIDAVSKPFLETLQQRDAATEQAILAYDRKVREEIAKQNAKALEKFEKKVDRLEQKAADEGKPVPLIIPPILAAAPAKTVTVGDYKQTVVKRKAWRLGPAFRDTAPREITAQEAAAMASPIPLEYFILDTARIGKVIRAGGSIPGIEVYEEESIAVRS